MHARKGFKPREGLSINLQSCKYEVMRDVAEEMGIAVSNAEDDDWDLLWTDLSVTIERVQSLRTFQRLNHFPGMLEICRKAALSRNFRRISTRLQAEYSFLPRSLVLPDQLDEFFGLLKRNQAKGAQSMEPTPTYILKPTNGCMGKGISLVQTMEQVQAVDVANVVAQLYIPKPLLIDGFKFDLRLYALVLSVDPLKIFLYDEGLARLATEPYQAPQQDNLSSVSMHLTNYAVNKDTAGFVSSDPMGRQGSKRLASVALQQVAERHATTKAHLVSAIAAVIVKTILCIQPTLAHTYHTALSASFHGTARTPKGPPCSCLSLDHQSSDSACTAPPSQCFEVLGFDIMLDSQLQPWLIEVNHSPSFSTDSTIDKQLKHALLKDTVRALNLRPSSKMEYFEEESRQQNERLYKNPHTAVHRAISSASNSRRYKTAAAAAALDELKNTANSLLASSAQQQAAAKQAYGGGNSYKRTEGQSDNYNGKPVDECAIPGSLGLMLDSTGPSGSDGESSTQMGRYCQIYPARTEADRKQYAKILQVAADLFPDQRCQCHWCARRQYLRYCPTAALNLINRATSASSPRSHPPTTTTSPRPASAELTTNANARLSPTVSPIDGDSSASSSAASLGGRPSHSAGSSRGGSHRSSSPGPVPRSISAHTPTSSAAAGAGGATAGCSAAAAGAGAGTASCSAPAAGAGTASCSATGAAAAGGSNGSTSSRADPNSSNSSPRESKRSEYHRSERHSSSFKQLMAMSRSSPLNLPKHLKEYQKLHQQLLSPREMSASVTDSPIAGKPPSGREFSLKLAQQKEEDVVAAAEMLAKAEAAAELAIGSDMGLARYMKVLQTGGLAASAASVNTPTSVESAEMIVAAASRAAASAAAAAAASAMSSSSPRHATSASASTSSPHPTSASGLTSTSASSPHAAAAASAMTSSSSPRHTSSASASSPHTTSTSAFASTSASSPHPTSASAFASASTSSPHATSTSYSAASDAPPSAETRTLSSPPDDNAHGSGGGGGRGSGSGNPGVSRGSSSEPMSPLTSPRPHFKNPPPSPDHILSRLPDPFRGQSGAPHPKAAAASSRPCTANSKHSGPPAPPSPSSRASTRPPPSSTFAGHASCCPASPLGAASHPSRSSPPSANPHSSPHTRSQSPYASSTRPSSTRPSSPYSKPPTQTASASTTPASHLHRHSAHPYRAYSSTHRPSSTTSILRAMADMPMLESDLLNFHAPSHSHLQACKGKPHSTREAWTGTSGRPHGLDGLRSHSQGREVPMGPSAKSMSAGRTHHSSHPNHYNYSNHHNRSSHNHGRGLASGGKGSSYLGGLGRGAASPERLLRTGGPKTRYSLAGAVDRGA